MTDEGRPGTIRRDTYVRTWVFIGTIAIIALAIAIFVLVRPDDGEAVDPMNVGEEDEVSQSSSLRSFVVDGVEVVAA